MPLEPWIRDVCQSVLKKNPLAVSEWREVIVLCGGVVSIECFISLKDHHHLQQHYKTIRTWYGLSYLQRNELMSRGDTSQVVHATDSLLSQCFSRCHWRWEICNLVPGMVFSFAKLQFLLVVTGHISPALTWTLSSRPGKRPPAQTNKRTVQPLLLLLKSSPNPGLGLGMPP